MFDYSSQVYMHIKSRFNSQDFKIINLNVIEYKINALNKLGKYKYDLSNLLIKSGIKKFMSSI